MASASSPIMLRRTYTECDRCFRRINNTSSSEEKKQLTTEFLINNLIDEDFLNSTDPEVLKDLAIVTIDLNNCPTDDQKKLNCYQNIKRIYDIIIQNPINYANVELLLISDYLRVNANMVSRLTAFKETKLSCVSCLTALELLHHDPIQWSFRTLDADQLVLGYKAFTSTNSLLQNVKVALEDSSFSPEEKNLLQRRLIKVLMTWLKERHFIAELSQASILHLFECILKILNNEGDATVKSEAKNLRVHLKASLTITPRSTRDSFSLSPIEGLLVDMIHESKRNFEKKCEEFTAEITCYFVNLMADIPVEEYFKPLDTLALSPHLSHLTQATNALENWLHDRFNELEEPKSKRNFQKALLQSMLIAYKKHEYQTAFSLKIVLDKCTGQKKPEKMPENLSNAYDHFTEVFSPFDNLKNLVSTYHNATNEGHRFMPVFGYINKFLLPILALPVTETYKEFKVYNSKRFELIFKTLHPFFNFVKMASTYSPKTNLRQKVMLERSLSSPSFTQWSEHAQEGSSSSDALALPV